MFPFCSKKSNRLLDGSRRFLRPAPERESLHKIGERLGAPPDPGLTW
jgi:hypothetical protein